MRVLGLVMVLVVAVAVSDAGAHVTIQPKEAVAKSYQEFVVRVPTEKNQPTTSVRVVFPEGFELLRVKPAMGWKYELEKDASGRVTAITWSGGRIGLTEYEVFNFMARANAPGTFKLDAYQTYGESDVVAWVNAAEPRPAPQVKVVAAPAAAPSNSSADPFSSRPSTAAAAPATTNAPARDNVGMMLGGAAVAVSLIALLISVRRPRLLRT
jgi:YD repeat-containing protein